MRIIVFFAVAFLMGSCESDLGPEASEIQERQMQRSFYGPGNPALRNPPPDTAPQREPVPGEVEPDR